MRFKAILLFSCTLSLFITSLSFSQPSETRMGPGMPHWRRENRGWRASELNLSPQQSKELSLIQQTYYRETQILRAQLLSKRLELREILTNPSVKIEAIRSKYSEMKEIQSRFDEKTAEYLIRVRTFLKPDQLRNWNPEEEVPFLQPMPPGPHPMGPMRPRKNPPSRDQSREE
ncbi:MAG: Spy/CpxP family protein refolding chaperone [Thermodesulfobacteriota bacterium]